MTDNTTDVSLSADVPINKKEDDSFRFSIQAKVVSDLIVGSFKQPDSLVLGVTGPWGSGKTSLINLVLRNLERPNRTENHIVLKYSPWIIGNHESILAKFLPALEEKIRSKSSSKKQIDTLRTYAKYVSKTIHGLNLELSNLDWANLNLIGFMIKVFNLIVSWLCPNKSNRSLEDIKEDVIKQLNQHKTPVLVVLDDIDRLEPIEIQNILRLVRSTANLPYIVYLLSYDHDKVAQMLTDHLRIDGHHYLEKIIQLPIKVPEVSSSILSQHLQKKLYRLIAIDELSSECKKRLDLTIQNLFQVGSAGYPRDISRLLNLMAFRLRLSENKIDPADATFVWTLEMKYPRLYNWIRDYSRMYSARMYSARMNSYLFEDPERLKIERGRYLSNLILACKEDGTTLESIEPLLAGAIPGIERLIAKDEEADENESRYMFKLFTPVDDRKVFNNRKTKRLASDLHWRNYFSYADVSLGWSLEKISDLIKHSTEQPDNLAEELLRASKNELSSGGTEAERIIELIESMAENDEMSDADRLSVFKVLVNSIDPIADTKSDAYNKEYIMFWKAQSLTITLLKPIASQIRMTEMFDTLENGQSKSWILFFIRNILKIHGTLPFDQSFDEPNWMNERELATLKETALRIIRRLIRDKNFIFSVFESKWVFYAWHDLADDVEQSEMRLWIEDTIKDDSYLLKFIEIFSTMQSSSEFGDRWSISLSDLRMFIDLEKAIERLDTIKMEPGKLQEQAVELKARIEVAKEW